MENGRENGPGGALTEQSGVGRVLWRDVNEWNRVERISKRALLLAVLTATAAACSDEEATHTCVTESNCLDGQICRNQKCETPRACRSNADCIDTEVCQSGRCEPRQCDAADACGGGRVCVSGWCVAPGSVNCQSDIECASGACDVLNGVCLLGDSCTGEGCRSRDADVPDINPVAMPNVRNLAPVN